MSGDGTNIIAKRNDTVSFKLVGSCRSSEDTDALFFSPFPIDQLLHRGQDRKSTRLNSSHVSISYAVFCLKKKETTIHLPPHHLTVHQADVHNLRLLAT